jgi:hypothetical protein
MKLYCIKVGLVIKFLPFFIYIYNYIALYNITLIIVRLLHYRLIMYKIQQKKYNLHQHAEIKKIFSHHLAIH